MRQRVALLLLFYCFVAAEAYLPVPEFGKEQYIDLPVKVLSESRSKLLTPD